MDKAHALGAVTVSPSTRVKLNLSRTSNWMNIEELFDAYLSKQHKQDESTSGSFSGLYSTTVDSDESTHLLYLKSVCFMLQQHKQNKHISRHSSFGLYIDFAAFV